MPYIIKSDFDYVLMADPAAATTTADATATTAVTTAAATTTTAATDAAIAAATAAFDGLNRIDPSGFMSRSRMEFHEFLSTMPGASPAVQMQLCALNWQHAAELVDLTEQILRDLGQLQ